MNKITQPLLRNLFLLLFLLMSIFSMGQVGIGTTAPEGAMDISSTTEGLLIPRTALTSNTDILTITNPQGGALAVSTLVYNDGTGGLAPAGFYYWNGVIWVNLSAGNYWNDNGNLGTNPATNFLGTIDNQDLSIRTNNTQVLYITAPDASNDPKIQAGNGNNRGDEQDPLYTFSNDDNTGIWSDGGDEFSLGGGGQEFLTIDEGATEGDVLIVNEDGDDINFRVESNNDPNALYVDASQDNIGINTNTPDNSASLELNDSNRGFLINRVALTSTTDTATVTGAEATGLLVYNTSTIADVTPGFYYWDGVNWTRLISTISNDWGVNGNAGTVATTNFLGTTDAEALTFRTNDRERFRVSNGDQVFALADGSINRPFYSWENDPDVGIWKTGNDQMSLGAGGLEFIRLREAGADQLVVNEGGNDINFRVESNNDQNKFFVDGGTDRIGINTGVPATDIHIAGNNTVTRVDSFNAVNNANNNGIDLATVYADANGDLVLGAPLIHSNMPTDNSTTFVPATVNVTSNSGAWAQATLHNGSVTITQDSLIEVVFQLGVNIVDRFGGPITDGDPRQYGAAIILNGNVIGYTSESYTSAGSSWITSGTYFLNGNGYVQLTPGTYNIQVVGFVFGANEDNVRGQFGGNAGLDRFQVIVHH